MFKKNLYLLFFIIFSTLIFAEEKSEDNYDDVILYGDERIELKQEKLDFLPKENEKLTIKEDLNLNFSTSESDTLQGKTLNNKKLNYNVSVFAGNKSNIGLRADLLFKGNFTLQNSTFFNHNNYDIKDHYLFFKDNGLFQSNSFWSLFYDFQFEKFDYNNNSSTNNFLSKTLFSVKRESYSVNFGFGSIYLSEADFNQSYLLGTFNKSFSKFNLNFNSEIGKNIFLLNSKFSVEHPFSLLDIFSSSLIFYRDFDTFTYDNTNTIIKKESNYDIDAEFNFMKKLYFKGHNFYFSFYREFVYETLYDLYNINRYFYSDLESKRLYSKTGFSLKTFGDFNEFSYEIDSKIMFLDNYMFFVNPAKGSIFSLATKDNWLFKNSLLINRNFKYFNLATDFYINTYTDLDNITYQPLWGSNIAVKFNFWNIEYESDLDYIGLFYRDFNRKNEGGNVFYLNFSASKKIINEHFKLSVKLNNILNNDYDFWDGYNTYPFKLYLQLDYKN